MATPKWFDATTYLNNKLDQMHEMGYPVTYSKADLIADFNKAGFTTDADGLYKHFQKYGVKENISPNKYFDADYYFQSKAADYYDVDVTQVTDKQVAYMKDAFSKAGLSAWDHYLKYGMKEGIDPNANFNTNQYLEDKLQDMYNKGQADPATYGRDELVNAIKTAGLNPVSHYMQYGVGEGLTAKVATVHGGAAQALTTNPYDDLVGTTSIDDDGHNIDDDGNLVPDDTYNDYFTAEVGTLQSEDKVDGLGGVDTLYAIVDAEEPAGSLNPTIKNVEKVFFQSQIGDGDKVVEKAPVSAVIDADRISLAHYGEEGYTGNLFLGSVNSRADLRIEDVRHFSNETTVRFADADPEVDFHVYFDPQHLKADTTTTSGTLLVELMDVFNGAKHEKPLETNPYNEFKFYYTVNGKQELIDLKFPDDESLYTGDATYADLTKAFNEALAASYPELVGVLKIVEDGPFTARAYSTTDKTEYVYQGNYVKIHTDNGALTCPSDGVCGWKTDKTVPPDTNYDTRVTDDNPTDCPLIRVDVELTNVGRVQWDDASDCLPDDMIKGSNAGDLQIGSMSQRSGIERMDVYVDEGSWLAGLYSTNNTLRMVTVTARDINEDEILGNKGQHRSQDAGMADDDVNGQLYIGTWEGKLDEQGTYAFKDNLTWADKARLLTADGKTTGLNDVAVFNAESSAYTGNINIAADITEASYHKYLKGVDGVEPKNAPLEAYDGAFSYLTGSGNDVVNMTVNGDIAADVDFKMNIRTNAGDDLVAFQYSGMSENESFDNKYLQQVKIDTGDGDDTVWFYSGKVVSNHFTSTELVPVKDDEGNIVRYEEREVQNDNTVVADNGGAVKVVAGSGNDKVYLNQIDMMTGGKGSGVTDGPDFYNAVWVFNANDRSVGINGYNGATLNNNHETGPSRFWLPGVTTDTDLYVTVNFKGFTSDKYNTDNSAIKIDVTKLTKDATSVTAEQLNQAIIKAVNEDPTLSALIVAKDGAGHALIIESLINGNMVDDVLDIQFWASTDNAKTYTNVTSSLRDSNGITTDKWYMTEFGDRWGEDYTGHDAYVENDIISESENGAKSQAVVDPGSGNDVIVLGKNGQTGEGTAVFTFTSEDGSDVDVTKAEDGNTLSVKVGSDIYIGTYKDGDFQNFQTVPDVAGEKAKKLDDAGWKYEGVKTESTRTGFSGTEDLSKDVQTPTTAKDTIQIKITNENGDSVVYEAKAVEVTPATETTPATYTWGTMNYVKGDLNATCTLEDSESTEGGKVLEVTYDTIDVKEAAPTVVGSVIAGTKTQDLSTMEFEEEDQISTVATFTKTDDDAKDISDGKIALGGGETELKPGDELAASYTITTTDAAPAVTADSDVLTVTVQASDGNTYTFTNTADETSWSDSFKEVTSEYTITTASAPNAPTSDQDRLNVEIVTNTTTMTLTAYAVTDPDTDELVWGEFSRSDNASAEFDDDGNIVVTYTVQDGENTPSASYAIDGDAWTNFEDAEAVTHEDIVTVNWSGETGGTYFVQYNTQADDTDAPKATQTLNEGTSTDLPEAKATEGTEFSEILPLEDIEPQDDDEVHISVTVQGKTTDYVAKVSNGDLGQFETADGTAYRDVTGEIVEQDDGSYAIKLSSMNKATLDSVNTNKPTYLEVPTETEGDEDDVQGGVTLYGRDVIELNDVFGDDTVVDFETGIDRVNVAGLVGTSSVKFNSDATKLANGNVAEIDFDAKAATGIANTDEINGLLKGKLGFAADQFGNAVAFLHDTNATDNNVYTVVLVSKASASATATATYKGSLTLASDDGAQELIDASVDVVGTSALVDTPEFIDPTA